MKPSTDPTHTRAPCSPDPLYSRRRRLPDAENLSLFSEPGDGPCWLYGPGNLEAWLFNRLRHEAFRACMNVAHPGCFHAGSPLLHVRRCWHLSEVPASCPVRVAAHGNLHLTLNGHTLLHVGEGFRPEWWECDLTPHLRVGDNLIMARVHALGEPPTFLMAGALIQTDPHWEVSTDGARHFCAPNRMAFVGMAHFPHQERLPVVELAPRRLDEQLWDFGREVFGRPKAAVEGVGTVSFHPGESLPEARNRDSSHDEQFAPVIEVADATAFAPDELAMRYLRVAPSPGVTLREVRLASSVHPVCYHGDFRASDPDLDRIWLHAAYTLRLCMREVFVDGIKRDRLPWVGDLYLAGLANATSFFDAGIMRRSLMALYGPEPENVDFNGIIDYSFFWILALHDYLLHFGDVAFLSQLRPRLEHLLDALEQKRDAEGLIPSTACPWLFIDWAEVDKTGYSACLEFLSIRALSAAAELFAFLGDPASAAHWHAIVARRREAARQRFWSPSDGAFRDCTGSARFGRHANLLALLAEVPDARQREQVLDHLGCGSDLPPVGTPYMRSLEADALAKSGRRDAMLEILRADWGGMLRNGATSFWERYDAGESPRRHLRMYKRPFGASLCHAWSSGPVFLLSRGVFGLEPLAPGWARFAVHPRAVDLDRIRADVPTPHGAIRLWQDRQTLRIRYPAHTTCVLAGRDLPGPRTLSLALNGQPEPGFV